jgi:hypothetical protein
VGLLVNHSLYKKIGSMVINKFITLLEGTNTLEDSCECQVPQLHAPFLKICWQCVQAIQSTKVQNNSILGHNGVERINRCINELKYTKDVKYVIV